MAEIEPSGSELTYPCGAYVQRVITNGDRIRAMTDEELAAWIVEITYNGKYIEDSFRKLTEYTWRRWLQEPAEEEHE